jgi:predicted aspartyl protease
VSGVRIRSLVKWVLILAFPIRAASGPIAECPFQFSEKLVWVDVTIPQSKEPLSFLLDTGAGSSVINLDTAKRIGLKQGSKVLVRGVESTLTGYWPERMSAHAGDIQLPEKFLAVDLGTLSRSCERPVDGLLGADFFRGRIVQIDFDARKIRWLKSSEPGNSTETLPLQLRNGALRVPLIVNGREQQWVRLDTGCASALQWVSANVNPDESSRQTAVGLTQLSIPRIETTVRIGQQEFINVPTGVHEKAIFPGEAGLLGNELLSRFSRVTIDTKAGCLILEERRD